MLPSELMKAVLKFVNTKMPIWQAKDFYGYVYDAYLKNVDYASIVNFIAEKSAMIPFKQQIQVDKEWVDDEDTMIMDLYDNPNPTQGAYEYKVEAYSWFVITGNSYENCEAPRRGSDAGKILQMWNMPAHLTQVISGGWRKPVDSFKLTHSYSNEESIPVEQVIHMKRFNPRYQHGEFLQGLPKIATGSIALTSSNSGYKIKTSMLENGGVPGIMTGENSLSLEQKGWFRNLIRRFSSPSKKGSLPYINQKLEYIKIGTEMVDLKVMESLLNDKRALCALHGLDSKLFNDPDGSTFNNLRTVFKRAYLDAIIPVVEHRAAEHSRFLIPRFYPGDKTKRRIVPDLSGIEVLQTELKETASAIQMLKGVLTYGMIYDMLKITPPESMRDMLDEIPQGMMGNSYAGSGMDLESELRKLGIRSGEYQND